MKKLKIYLVIAVVVVLLVSGAFIIRNQGRDNPGILPPESSIQGFTYGEWLAKWWEYALILPAEQNPLLGGESCAIEDHGNVGLLVANSTLDVPIKCEVPAGKMLFVEVLGAECSDIEEPPFYGGTEEELRVCAQGFVPQDLVAIIDGKEVKDLARYIFVSPLYEFTNPEDNILEVPCGTVGRSIGSGAYLMLSPLNIGKHTVYLKGTYPDLEYTAEKTLEITVVTK